MRLEWDSCSRTIGGYAVSGPDIFANAPPCDACWGQLEHMLADDVEVGETTGKDYRNGLAR